MTPAGTRRGVDAARADAADGAGGARDERRKTPARAALCLHRQPRGGNAPLSGRRPGRRTPPAARPDRRGAARGRPGTPPRGAELGTGTRGRSPAGRGGKGGLRDATRDDLPGAGRALGGVGSALRGTKAPASSPGGRAPARGPPAAPRPAAAATACARGARGGTRGRLTVKRRSDRRSPGRNPGPQVRSKGR